MKTKYLLLIILSGAFILGGCITKNPSSSDDTSSSGEGDLFSGTLQAAAALGVPMKCTYKDALGNEMESFIKGNNYYAEMVSEGKEGFVIMKDKCMWAWDTDSAEGVTMCYEEGSLFDPETEQDFEPEENSPFDTVDPDMEYQCRPGTVDSDKFTPPEDVTFMDLSSMMQMFGGSAGLPGADSESFDSEAMEDSLQQMMDQVNQ